MRVAGGLAGAVGDQRSGGPRGNVALPFDVAVEQRIHDGGALGVGQHFAAQADQAARGHQELQAHAAGAVIDHLLHLALAAAQLLDHHADELFRAIDHQQLQRLGQVCRRLRLVRISGLPTASSIAFAPHHLDQDGELQFAAAHHLERVRTAGFFHADGNVGQQFLVQPVAQIARGDELAFAAGERRGVDGERHGDGRLVDLDVRQRLRRFRAGDRLADGDAFHAGDRQNVAGPADGFIHALQSFEGIQLGDLGLVKRAVQLGDGHFVAVAAAFR